MNIGLINFIGRRFSRSGGRSGFLNFARTVAFISVMLGSAALIIALSILDGFEYKLRDSAIKFTSHIQVHGFNAKPVRSFQSKIHEIEANFPQVKSVDAVVENQSLIRSKSAIEGVLVKGIDVDYNVGGIKSNIKEGSFGFSSPSAREIVLGAALAAKLNVAPGDRIILFSLDNSQPADEFNPEVEQFTVTGIYRTGFAKYDESIVYIPIATAAAFYKVEPGSATGLEIILSDIGQIGSLSGSIQDFLGYPYICNTVFEIHEAIFSWIELQKAPIPLVLGLISIVAVFNIITILLITIVEKTRSIGILRTLGMPPRDILAMFLAQGIAIAFIGSLAGCALGLGFGLLQQATGIIRLEGDIYFLDTLPVKISLWHYEVVIGSCLVVSTLASLAPSIAAVRIAPVKVLRFN